MRVHRADAHDIGLRRALHLPREMAEEEDRHAGGGLAGSARRAPPRTERSRPGRSSASLDRQAAAGAALERGARWHGARAAAALLSATSGSWTRNSAPRTKGRSRQLVLALLSPPVLLESVMPGRVDERPLRRDGRREAAAEDARAPRPAPWRSAPILSGATTTRAARAPPVAIIGRRSRVAPCVASTSSSLCISPPAPARGTRPCGECALARRRRRTRRAQRRRGAVDNARGGRHAVSSQNATVASSAPDPPQRAAAAVGRVAITAQQHGAARPRRARRPCASTSTR